MHCSIDDELIKRALFIEKLGVLTILLFLWVNKYVELYEMGPI